MVDFIGTYYGDKPFYVGEFRTANPDSAIRQKASVPETDYRTQEERGQAYYKVVTTYPDIAYSASGVRPYVGILWWQYLDNWGEKNDWGLVSLSDNAYDGKEARAGTNANSSVLAAAQQLPVRRRSAQLRRRGLLGEQRARANPADARARSQSRLRWPTIRVRSSFVDKFSEIVLIHRFH